MYLSFLGMAKATSFRDQLTGCFSLKQNFIVYIADNGRRAGSLGPLDMFFYLGSCQITLQPIVVTEEFSSPAHLDNISPLLSSFCTCDRLGLTL